MDQSPWEANCLSANWGISCTLWYMKLHHHMDKSQPLHHVVCQISLVHTIQSYCLKIHFNFLFLLCLGIPNDLFPSSFPVQNMYVLFFFIHATCPAHLILLDFITQIIFGEQCKSWNSSLCHLTQSFVIPSLLVPNIFLSTLFSSICSLYSMLSVTFQGLHPYKTEGKIILMCVVIFIFFSSKWEETRFWTGWLQAFPAFILLLICSWMQFWCVKSCFQVSEHCHTFRYVVLNSH